MERLPKFLRYILAVLAFWAIIFFGPLGFVLLNEINPASIEPGTLSYLFFCIIAQPCSCYLSCYAISFASFWI